MVWYQLNKLHSLSQSKHLQTMASLGFGSNQVDFGGITSPASAMAVNSLIWTGYMAKAATQSSLHLLTSSPNPLIPPTKSILSSPLISLIPRIGVNTNSVNNWESNYLVRLVLSTFSSFTSRVYHFLPRNKEHWPFFSGLGCSFISSRGPLMW